MNQNVICVIACGGYSTRMGKEKALLQYHDLPQFEHLNRLFSHTGLPIFLSLRKDQKINYQSFPFIILDDDKYAGHGPISGLLSCIQKFPDKSIVFIGCDYPLLSITEIEQLIHSGENTSSFFNLNYEPLLAVYHPSDYKKIEERFESKLYSLNNFLTAINAKKLIAENPSNLKSFDTIIEYKSFQKQTT